ncbi:hypothetical protein VE04_04661 [Pseudogymnoascus sp. 24MN13]|nr:hypothetical protein VE04_04661 [Pseudogymnoascus sp. 24MN13]
MDRLIESKRNRAVLGLHTEKVMLEKEVGTTARSTQNRSAFQLYHDNKALEKEKTLLKNTIKALEAESAMKSAHIAKLEEIRVLEAKIAELERVRLTGVPAGSFPALGSSTDAPGGASAAVGPVAPRRVKHSRFSLFAPRENSTSG